MPTTLDQLNASDRAGFVAVLGGIYERSPWVAERAFAARPFATVSDLYAAMQAAATSAASDEQLALIRSHPELAGKVAHAGDMTPESRHEQGSLGLDRLSDDEFGVFARSNANYRERFGFPFIICVRRHTRASILVSFARRLGNSHDAECRIALEEIGYIARLRLAEAVDGPGKPKVYGKLSTHVLDTMHGEPAAGISLVLKECGTSAEGILKRTVTNANGRTDEPLLDRAPLRIGTYEIGFSVGDYFAARGIAVKYPRFLEFVPVRFAIADPEGHYHVPLLVSPWSYSMYRGS